MSTTTEVLVFFGLARPPPHKPDSQSDRPGKHSVINQKSISFIWALRAPLLLLAALAECRPAARLALSLPTAVFTDANPAALLAPILPPVVYADLRPAALLARDLLPAVRTERAAATLLANALPLAVLARPFAPHPLANRPILAGVLDPILAVLF